VAFQERKEKKNCGGIVKGIKQKDGTRENR
jgi:hypothetical protein